MEAERQRQHEESSALVRAELEAHQASLAPVMVESRAKSGVALGAIDAAARAELEAAGAAAEHAAATELARVRPNELEAAEGRASACVASGVDGA